MDQRNFSLESMPTEILLEIMRHLFIYRRNGFKCNICLRPVSTYDDTTFGFGSMGVLCVSKHLSALALSVLYGENDYVIQPFRYLIVDDNSDAIVDDGSDQGEDDDDSRCYSPEHLKGGRWGNLRDFQEGELMVISSIDCLDFISQTRPGRERLRRLEIMVEKLNMIRFLSGVLTRILNRMRGLQSLTFYLSTDLEFWTPQIENDLESWPVCVGHNFLLQVKSELGHIKTVQLGEKGALSFFPSKIFSWIARELQKRNKAWVPPCPGHKNFKRTTTSMSLLDLQLVKEIARKEDKFKPKKDPESVCHLERTHGVFD